MRTVLFLLITVLLSGLSLYMKAQSEVPVKSGKQKTIVVRDGLPPKGEPIYGRNYFRNKAPFAINDSSVLFFLRGHKDAKTVILSGTFSNWSPTALSMTRTDSGWIANVKLGPGKWLYKFITDGYWITDTDNLLTETDENGNVNSVYYWPNMKFTLPSFGYAKKVYLVGSFNNWRSGELAMTKNATGWELLMYMANGKHMYRFLVDGKGHTDPNSSKLMPDEFGQPCSYFLVGKPDDLYEAFRIYQETITSGKENNSKLADQFANIGYVFLKNSRDELACKSFQNALTLYQQLKNHDSTASMCFNIASVYYKLSDLPRRLEYLQKALSAYEKAGNNYGVAKTEREIGYYYANLPSTPKAIEHFHRALSKFEQLGKQTDVARVMGNLGHMYLFMRDSAKSFSYLQKALNLNEQLGNKPEMGFNLWILGDYYFRILSNIPVAIECLQKAQELSEQTGDKQLGAYVFFNFADILLYAPDTALKTAQIKVGEKYIRSIEYQKKGIEIMKCIQPEYGLVIHFQVLSETYEKIGMYDSAYHYYKQYIAVRDKAIGTEKQKAIVRLETRVENEKIEDSLMFEKQLMNARLEKQVLLSNQQQQLVLTSKEKELQHLIYLKTQADLQNEQLSRQQKEKQLGLSEKEKELQSAKVKSLEQEKAIVKLNQQRQWIYVVAIFLFLGLALVYFIYRWRLRSVRLESQLAQERSEQQRKDAEFRRKLADISLLALRAQMNPHFIFNSMNSIKALINKNENDKAAGYLTIFSKLIRTLFQNSDKREISLFEEIETCRLYTQLEKMRFGDKVEFVFNVDDSIDLKDIKVPALILQPLIENAIWHGLVPKETGGRIIFSVKENDGAVQCIIDDDGIGRELSKQYNAQYEATHQSKGIGLTQSRLELDKLLNEREDSICIIDKKNGNGKAEGTKVVITFKENINR